MLDRFAFVCYNLFCLLSGEVSERFKELVLKTSDASSTVSSNLTLSAIACLYCGGKGLQFYRIYIRFGEILKRSKRSPC